MFLARWQHTDLLAEMHHESIPEKERIREAVGQIIQYLAEGSPKAGGTHNHHSL